MTDSVEIVTQEDVDTLLAQLERFHQQIKRIREDIAPLKAKLDQAYKEYQNAIGRLQHETSRLQMEISLLLGQIEGGKHIQEEVFTEQFTAGSSNGEPTAIPVDPDVFEKDVLLEHVFRVLDEDDDDLLSTLQGVCDDPTKSLADALERIPWGPIWQAKSHHENLVDQYRRLKAWEKALTGQLDILNNRENSLRVHPHFGLWQQREKGEQAWQEFLAQAVEKQKEQNEYLEAELKSLQGKWTEMGGNL